MKYLITLVILVVIVLKTIFGVTTEVTPLLTSTHTTELAISQAMGE